MARQVSFISGAAQLIARQAIEKSKRLGGAVVKVSGLSKVRDYSPEMLCQAIKALGGQAMVEPGGVIVKAKMRSEEDPISWLFGE